MPLTANSILLALSLFAASLVFSMYGQGGGLLYTPIQVFFGVEFHQAAASSQLFIIITSLSSTLVFHKARKVDWRLAFVLESTAVAGAFLGGVFAYRFSARAMLTVLGTVVAAAAFSMLKDDQPLTFKANLQRWVWLWKRETGGRPYTVRLAPGLLLSFLIGLVSGLAGVAGGFLKVPMMAWLFGMPIDIAFGTSAFMIGLTAAGGWLGHLATGRWDWRPALLLCLPIAAGAQIGPRLNLRTNIQTMRRRFGYLLFAVSLAVFSLGWLR